MSSSSLSSCFDFFVCLNDILHVLGWYIGMCVRGHGAGLAMESSLTERVGWRGRSDSVAHIRGAGVGRVSPVRRHDYNGAGIVLL